MSVAPKDPMRLRAASSACRGLYPLIGYLRAVTIPSLLAILVNAIIGAFVIFPMTPGDGCNRSEHVRFEDSTNVPFMTLIGANSSSALITH